MMSREAIETSEAGAGGASAVRPVRVRAQAIAGLSMSDQQQIPAPVQEIAQWLSTPRAAARLGVSRNWMHRMCVNNQIRNVHTDLGYLVDPSAVEEYRIAQRKMLDAKAAGTYHRPDYRGSLLRQSRAQAAQQGA